jgi:hypothetical protein
MPESAGVTARESLARYEQWFSQTRSQVKDVKLFDSENALSWRPRMPLEELEKLEHRLGCILPPSYRRFVLEHGLFQFGVPSYSLESKLLEPSEIDPLAEALKSDWGYDAEEEFGEEAAEALKKVIPFSAGDANMQIVYYYTFRLDLREGNDGEAPIDSFDQDEIESCVEPPSKTAPQSFDQHIAKRVAKKIEEVEEYVEEGRYED